MGDDSTKYRNLSRNGRKKGSKNKVNSELKEMVLGALSDVGGRDYLAMQAVKNPTAFMTLVGKCLPREVTGKDGKDLIPDKATGVLVVPAVLDSVEWEKQNLQ